MDELQQMQRIHSIIQKIEKKEIGHKRAFNPSEIGYPDVEMDLLYECINSYGFLEKKKSIKKCKEYLKKILTEFQPDDQTYWATEHSYRIIFIYTDYYLYIKYNNNEISIVTDKELTKEQDDALIEMIKYSCVTWLNHWRGVKERNS